MSIEFKAWPKIARGKGQHVTISEKLDGTNACVIIIDGELTGVQSRKRLLTLDNDNYGFCKWAYENKEKLEELGDGYHYGEWYGEGIQKNHHKKDGKYFALFNTFRWTETPLPIELNLEIVPILYVGPVDDINIENAMLSLELQAKELDYTPEGVVAYYHNTKTYEKYTFKSPNGKWVKGRN